MKDNNPAQPQNIFFPLIWLFLFGSHFLDYGIQNIFINSHKKAGNVQLKIKSVFSVIFCYSAAESFKSINRFVGAFAFTAGIAVVDKNFFANGFNFINQKMVDHSVAKTGGKNFSGVGLFNHKANRAPWLIFSLQ